MVGLLIFSGQAEAAILSINPRQEEFALGETFIVEVHLNSEGEVINAVKATINYDPDMLEVINVSKGGSFLTLWAQEPTFESSAGLVTLAGGIPNGSHVFDGIVTSITFRTRTPGGAEITFDQSNTSVHLNDGLGTSLPIAFKEGVFQISETTFITITSPTHPDENKWYKNNSFTVNWGYSSDSKYSYVLSEDQDEVPDNKPEYSEGVVTFPDLEDGIFYFILREQSADSEPWQVVGKRRVMIDSQPPLPISALVSQDDQLFGGKFFLIFSTVDKVSGVDHYDIVEGGSTHTYVDSPYVLKDQTRQSGLTVKAFDKAGNIRLQIVKEAGQQISESSQYTLLIVIICVIIILLLFLYVGTKSRK